jgi:hypothetical protein
MPLKVGIMRRFLASVLLSLCLASFSLAKDVTIHGFVTAVQSPTSFEVDDYKIRSDKSVSIDLDSSEGEKAPAFQPEQIRIGTEIEVKGEYDEQSGELKAKSVKVFEEDTVRVHRMALLEKLPSLAKGDDGWKGEVYADDQKISVVPTTAVTLRLNRSERKARESKQDHDEMPLKSVDEVNLDTFVRYEGTRAGDGSILAKKIEFQHAEFEPGEAKMWKKLDPKVTDPDYSAFRPGELKMHWKSYKIVPNREAQEYVARIGESLIPAHQKELPPDSPLKIPFRFYLVESNSFNAVTYPNGVVVVHSNVFDVLENEAQLAFILSHEISHAVEKHTWLEAHYHRNELIAMRVGGAFIPAGGGIVADLLASGIKNQYSRSLENQADRVGLEWMYAAGYDVREAPQTWKAVSKKHGDRVTNPFWDSHDNGTTRRSYLMAELRNNYSGVDFSTLKKDSDEFHHVVEAVKQYEVEQKKKK